MAEPTPSNARIQLSSEVLFRELQGEAVLLDLQSQRYYGLDPVGTRIWLLLAEHGRLAPVLEALLREFDVDPATLAKDLKEFLSHLEASGLLSLPKDSEESFGDLEEGETPAAGGSPP